MMALLLGLLFGALKRWPSDPLKVIFLLLDVLVNYTEMSLLLLSWPTYGDWTVTKRLKRIKDDAGWRGDLGRRVSALVNKIVPGHI